MKTSVTYKFKVAAYVSSGNTKYYGEKSSFEYGSSCPEKATLKSIKKKSRTEAIFKWNKVSGASGYYIYKKNYSGEYYYCTSISGGSTVSSDLTNIFGISATYKIAAYRVVDGKIYVGALSRAKTVK